MGERRFPGLDGFEAEVFDRDFIQHHGAGHLVGRGRGSAQRCDHRRKKSTNKTLFHEWKRTGIKWIQRPMAASNWMRAR